MRSAVVRSRGCGVLCHVPTNGTWFAIATASVEVDPLADTAEGLTRRMQDGAYAASLYNPATHFAGFALPNVVLQLLRSNARLVTDSGLRLDHPQFRNGAHWTNVVLSSAVENALTCQTDL
jgi:hypothetical protein